MPATCLLCGSDVPRLLFRRSRNIFECPCCGLVYAEPAPLETLARHYSEEYYRGAAYADYFADREAILRNAKRALDRLEKKGSGRRLLDVGCASGFFLEAAQARGWSVMGIDLSEYASAYARERLGLHVVTGTVDELEDDAGPFDVVTLWDCIEHLDRPDLALTAIHRRLEPGGRILLSTGDHDCLVRRLTGRRWRLFSDPSHNFFFTPVTLDRLLSRTGFEVTEVSHRGKWVSLAMVLQQAPLPLSATWRRRLQRAFGRRHLYVNLWDVMTVTAVKGAAKEPPVALGAAEQPQDPSK